MEKVKYLKTYSLSNCGGENGIEMDFSKEFVEKLSEIFFQVETEEDFFE